MRQGVDYLLAQARDDGYFGHAHGKGMYDQGTGYMREAMLLGFTGVEEAKQHPDFHKMRQNSRIAAKLDQAMFEPDNLFKLTKLDKMSRK